MQQSQPLKAVFLFLLAFTGLVQTALAQQTKTVVISNFNNITVSSGIDLYLMQGSTESVKVVSDGDLLMNVIVEKKGTTLHLRYKDNVSWERMFKGQKIKAYVNYKTLTAISASGGSDVFTQNTLKTPKLNISASGGADITLDLMAQDLQVQSSGGADINLKGKATNMEVSSSGGSDVDAFNFIVENARVNSSGGADVNIHVTRALDANASGGSDIVFKGKAALKNTSSRSGSVKRY